MAPGRRAAAPPASSLCSARAAVAHQALGPLPSSLITELSTEPVDEWKKRRRISRLRSFLQAAHEADVTERSPWQRLDTNRAPCWAAARGLTNRFVPTPESAGEPAGVLPQRTSVGRPGGCKPLIHNIYSGFAQRACECSPSCDDKHLQHSSAACTQSCPQAAQCWRLNNRRDFCYRARDVGGAALVFRGAPAAWNGWNRANPVAHCPRYAKCLILL